MKRAIPFYIALLMAGLLAACGSSPKARFYTLGPDTTLATTGSVMQVPLVVNPVTVPDTVDRPQIVTLLASNEVSIDEFGRWAEPLRGGIARAIAGDLSALLGSQNVSVYDSGGDAGRTWRVRVDIMRFDSAPGEAVAIEALWTVKPPGKEAPITGRSMARERVTSRSTDALVAAHDRALAAVSRDICMAIRSRAVP